MKTSIAILGLTMRNAEIMLNEIVKDKAKFIVGRTQYTVETPMEFYHAYEWTGKGSVEKGFHELYFDESLRDDELEAHVFPCLWQDKNNIDYKREDHIHCFYYD